MEQTRQYAVGKRRDPQVKYGMRQLKRDQATQEASSSLVSRMLDDKHKTDANDLAVLASSEFLSFYRASPPFPKLHKSRSHRVAQHTDANTSPPPETIIPLPLSKAPSDWKNFFTYYKEVLKQRLTDRVQIFQQTIQHKEKWWKKATFRAERKGITEVALNLHAAMSHALARGGAPEKMYLHQICVPKLARSLVAAIESRPKGKSYGWERLETTGWPFWPRLIDHKWTEVDVGFPMSFRQAVVGIKSKQRLTELDAKGKVVGSKEMELTEYVVLWRTVDKASQTVGEWQLYGTLKETTLEELIEETESMKRMQDMYAAKKLQERKKMMDR